MDAIKTESAQYVTYAFLIQGNEFKDTTIKLQLFLGNILLFIPYVGENYVFSLHNIFSHSKILPKSYIYFNKVY